jgi:hypothetical protein
MDDMSLGFALKDVTLPQAPAWGFFYLSAKINFGQFVLADFIRLIG